MSDFCRIAWTEGMFLRPQHFQQQERFITHQMTQLVDQLGSYAWGIFELELDETLLGLGQLSVARLQAVMPDGCAVMAPGQDPLPEVLKVAKGVRDQLVYIAIPADKSNAVNLAANDAGTVTRYHFDDHQVTDTSIGQDAVETLQIARLSMHLKLSGENLSGYVTLPIARIVEVDEDGGITLDRKFIPPCLNVQRNPAIKQMLSELRGMLQQRGDALAARLTQGQGTASSIADFLMLQLINRYQPLLAHIEGTDGMHPETLCRELNCLAGELATFSSSTKRAPQLPVYQHDELTSVLGNFMTVLNQHLSAVLEQTAVRLALETTKFGIRVAAVADKGLLDKAVFVIAVKADIPGEELRRRLPAQIKIGPVEHIRDLVNNQLPGIAATALPVAPRQIPYHAGYHYFQLDNSNDYWSRLSASGGVAVHLSGHYPELDMEMWAITH